MRNETSWLDELDRQFADDPEYIVHGMLLDITEDICEAMEHQGISRSELANRLGVSRQYITNFLNTPTNTTLKSVVEFAVALGLEPHVRLQTTGPRDFVHATWEEPTREDALPFRQTKRATVLHPTSEGETDESNIPSAA